ncbi:MAG: hypothetical protein OCD76_10140 [Reichenbachiella sp.]
MDDSNIYYYIILGVIYIISRVLKKKKKENAQTEVVEGVEEIPTTPRNPNTFEDLFKELTGEDFATKPESPKETIPVATTHEEIQQVINPAPLQPQYHEDDLIDIVPHKQLERKKPTYERLDTFKIEEEEYSLAAEIAESLQNEDEIKKAIIYKEIFDRKY